MRQLSGLDAAFLSMELSNAPMHVGSLAIYDPSTAPNGKVGFKQILSQIRDRGRSVRSMTEVIQSVPLDLDYPYWRSDGNFDAEFHVRHISLPKPGDWRQLCIQISRLHARPIDRSRPLWEMYVIEGLDNIEGYPKGCFAVFSKVHHAAIDGASGTEMAAALHDLSPVVPAQSADAGAKIPDDAKPSSARLLFNAQINNLRQPLRFLGVARNTLPKVAKTITGLAKGDLTRIKDVPRTRFNTKVSPHRVFDSVKFDLSEARQIKNSVEGVTINDVALSVCGGALRHYLLDKNELPEKSLVAAAPINVRTEDKKGAGGNEVSNMSVKLCTDIADPKERLLAVNQGTRNAKSLTAAIGAKTMTDYAQLAPYALTGAAARVSSRFGLADRGQPNFNCSVTNVPGPQVPLYFQGAKMLGNYGVGPVLDGIGIFNIINSYCGELSVSFTSCRDMIPDPAFYADCIRKSFQELYSSTVGDKSAPKVKRKKRSKK